MSKRFTDSQLWQKSWFMELTPAEKLAWFYIKDQCDNVGVWEPNFRLAEFVIGLQLDWDKFAEKCNDNVRILPTGKWFLVDFCDFQYGELKESCPPHRSYIALLRKHGLKGYSKGIGTLQEKEKEKDTDKEEEEEKDGTKKRANTKHPELEVPMNLTRYENLCGEYGKPRVDQAIQERMDWEAANGKKPAADYASAAANWIKNAEKFSGGKSQNDLIRILKEG